MKRTIRTIVVAAFALAVSTCSGPPSDESPDYDEGVNAEAPFPADVVADDATTEDLAIGDAAPDAEGVAEQPVESPPPDAIAGPPREGSTAPCPVLGQAVTPALCEYYTSQWDELEEGRGVIDRPDTMQRGEIATVSLVLGRPDEASAPTDEAMEDMLGAEADQQFDVRVGRRMAAELRGNGFEIEPEGIVRKDLFLGQGQRWDWNITAIRAPRHRLQVITYAVIDSPDGAKENLLRTETIDVPVSLTWQDWVTDRTADFSLVETFLLALAAVLAAGLAVWVGLKKFRTA